MPSDFWKPDSDTIWISSPSRIQDTPSPKTTDQWNFVHGSRSMRAGTRLLMAPSVRCATASLIPTPSIRIAVNRRVRACCVAHVLVRHVLTA